MDNVCETHSEGIVSQNFDIRLSLNMHVEVENFKTKVTRFLL